MHPYSLLWISPLASDISLLFTSVECDTKGTSVDEFPCNFISNILWPCCIVTSCCTQKSYLLSYLILQIGISKIIIYPCVPREVHWNPIQRFFTVHWNQTVQWTMTTTNNFWAPQFPNLLHLILHKSCVLIFPVVKPLLFRWKKLIISEVLTGTYKNSVAAVLLFH